MRNLFRKIGSLDDIETLSEVLEIKKIAGKSRQPISTFCRDYHHRFNISHTELHLVISYLIEKGRLDYSQGFLAPGLSEGRNKKDKTDIAGNQAVGDESKTDKSWQTLVMSSSLSVRATNVLLKTFSSLDELLAFDKEALFGLRNCGRNRYGNRHTQRQ